MPLADGNGSRLCPGQSTGAENDTIAYNFISAAPYTQTCTTTKQNLTQKNQPRNQND